MPVSREACLGLGLQRRKIGAGRQGEPVFVSNRVPGASRPERARSPSSRTSVRGPSAKPPRRRRVRLQGGRQHEILRAEAKAVADLQRQPVDQERLHHRPGSPSAPASASASGIGGSSSTRHFSG
jgi:hypothetical protein